MKYNLMIAAKYKDVERLYKERQWIIKMTELQEQFRFRVIRIADIRGDFHMCSIKSDRTTLHEEKLIISTIIKRRG